MPRTRYRQDTIKLSDKNIEHILTSTRNAYKNGTPLNRFVTLNLEEVLDSNPKKVLKSVLDNYKKFSRSKSFNYAYLWCLENNTGSNLHAHILLHIPASSAPRLINLFKRKLRDSWLMRSAEDVTKTENWFKCQTIPYGPPHEEELFFHSLGCLKNSLMMNTKNSQSVAKMINENFSHPISGYYEFQNVINVLGYILKGSVPYSEGSVSGRRIGRSFNIIGSR